MPITQTEPRTTPSILRASMIVHLRASRLFAMAPISAGTRGAAVAVDSSTLTILKASAVAAADRLRASKLRRRP